MVAMKTQSQIFYVLRVLLKSNKFAVGLVRKTSYNTVTIALRTRNGVVFSLSRWKYSRFTGLIFKSTPCTQNRFTHYVYTFSRISCIFPVEKVVKRLFRAVVRIWVGRDQQPLNICHFVYGTEFRHFLFSVPDLCVWFYWIAICLFISSQCYLSRTFFAFNRFHVAQWH